MANLLYEKFKINHNVQLNNEDINQALDAVSEFRSAYSKLPNKNIDADVKQILRQTWDRHFHSIDDKKLFNTIRKDYTDAFGRFLIYTNLFYLDLYKDSSFVKEKPANSTTGKSSHYKYEYSADSPVCSIGLCLNLIFFHNLSPCFINA